MKTKNSSTKTTTIKPTAKPPIGKVYSGLPPYKLGQGMAVGVKARGLAPKGAKRRAGK